MSNKHSNSKKNVKTANRKIDKKSIKRKSTSWLCLMFLVFIFLLVALVGTVFGDIQQVFANKNETKELNNRYDSLLEEEASLNSQVVKLQDPEYKARYARENQMYTGDGETILIIIDEEDEEKEK